jgi:NhaP-type Na+/H+ or K+/H+ antiporter
MGFDDSKGLNMTLTDATMMGLTFCYLSFCSIVIGIFFGLLCAYVFKVLNLEHHPVREIFLLLLFAYVSYITSEMMGYSGIMTLFCCGLAMAHYAYKNLSPKSKIGSVLAIETIGHGAEAFVFTYLGLSIYSIE